MKATTCLFLTFHPVCLIDYTDKLDEKLSMKTGQSNDMTSEQRQIVVGGLEADGHAGLNLDEPRHGAVGQGRGEWEVQGSQLTKHRGRSLMKPLADDGELWQMFGDGHGAAGQAVPHPDEQQGKGEWDVQGRRRGRKGFPADFKLPIQ